MNETLKLIFERRSIRRFRPDKINDETIKKILIAGQRAPTACSLQMYSFIVIKNEDVKKKLWEACGRPDAMLQAPVIIIICADIWRLKKIRSLLLKGGSSNDYIHTPLKLLSIIDAALAAENMVLAAEALGLSSLFIGMALANEEVIKILKLPRGVLPLMALCIGYADEDPPIRPRFPLDIVVHYNGYNDKISDEKLLQAVDYMTKKLGEEEYYLKYSRKNVTYAEHFIHKTSKKYLVDTYGEEVKFKELLNKIMFNIY